MTGAGSATVAVAVEDSYGTLPGTPTWFQPGIDVEVGSASLDNALTRARHPDDPKPATSREGNLEGALSVTFTMTDTNFHDLVFAGSSGLPASASLAPTATWYLESETLPSSVPRIPAGAAVESVAWNWQQGEDVQVELTIIYGDEADISAPSSISQPSEADAVPWHASTLDVNGVTTSKMQSFTLEIAGLARFRRGGSRTPEDAVVGAIQPTLTVDAILEDGTRRDLAYGSTTASTPQDTIDSVPGTATFANSSGTVATLNLSGLQPNSYDWSDLVAPDTDITDPTEFHVTDVQVA